MLALLAFLPGFPKDLISFRVWTVLAVVWALGFLVTFILLLRLGERNRNAQDLVSVLCTIGFGLPAILLGAIPAVGPGLVPPPHSEQQVSLADLPPAHGDAAPQLFVIGLDVSKSFSPGKDDQVRTALLRLFDKQGTAGRSMGGVDEFQVYTFSHGRPGQLLQGDESGHLVGRGHQDLLELIKDSQPFWKRTPHPDTPKLDLTKTDVLEFVRDISANLQSASHHRSTRLVLLSDFIQSPALDSQKQIEILRQILGSVANLSNFKILALRSAAAPTEKDGADVLRPLRDALGEELLQEIDLDHYAALGDEAEQVALPLGVVAASSQMAQCDLVPPAADGSGSTRLLLDIPKSRDFDEIFFGLHAGESTITPVELSIPECDGSVKGSCILAPEPNGTRFCKLTRKASTPNPVVINIDSNPRSAANARGTLDVFVPARNQYGTISLRINRIGNLALFRIASVIVAILNLVPAWLSLKLFHHARRPRGGDPGRAVAGEPAIAPSR